MLFLDGVYVDDSKYESAVRFQWIQPPTTEELARLTHTIANGLADIWSDKAFWSGMPIMATSTQIQLKMSKTRCINCMGLR